MFTPRGEQHRGKTNDYEEKVATQQMFAWRGDNTWKTRKTEEGKPQSKIRFHEEGNKNGNKFGNMACRKATDVCMKRGTIRKTKKAATQNKLAGLKIWLWTNHRITLSPSAWKPGHSIPKNANKLNKRCDRRLYTPLT